MRAMFVSLQIVLVLLMANIITESIGQLAWYNILAMMFATWLNVAQIIAYFKLED